MADAELPLLEPEEDVMVTWLWRGRRLPPSERRRGLPPSERRRRLPPSEPGMRRLPPSERRRRSQRTSERRRQMVEEQRQLEADLLAERQALEEQHRDRVAQQNNKNASESVVATEVAEPDAELPLLEPEVDVMAWEEAARRQASAGGGCRQASRG
jgi:hypothetical protein